MVEREGSFGDDDDEIDDEQSQKVANTTSTGDHDDNHEDGSKAALLSVTTSSGVTGQYDDAPDDYCINSGSGLLVPFRDCNGDNSSLATTTTTATATAISAPDLTISSMTEEEATARSPPPPSMLMMTNPPAASNVWSDEEVERIVMDLLLLSNGTATATGPSSPSSPPSNVLDLRRNWTRLPVPDTRQLNRVLYRLRDKGEIEQLPPNGKNQKPCWKATNIIVTS